MIPANVSVVLVEPNYPVNVGHVARLVKNFGVRRLYFVKPKVDFAMAAVYASHASDVLDTARVTKFETVREEHQLLVATTAVRASKKSNVVRRTVRPERLRELLASSSTAAVVFGRDTTGLTNEEIAMCDATMTLETGSAYRSLNLGHAVAITLYLASRDSAKKGRPQSRMAREVFARSLYELASTSGMPPYRVKGLFESGKRIVAASSLTDAQLNMMTGVLRKALAAVGAQAGSSKT